MLTNIVPRTRDCVGIIAGVQNIDGPLKVKFWGVRTPVTPAALTPMLEIDCVLTKPWEFFKKVIKTTRTTTRRRTFVAIMGTFGFQPFRV